MKKIIRLTESDLHNMIAESLNKILNEEKDRHFSNVQFDDKGRFGVFTKKPGFSDEEISDAMNTATNKHFKRLDQRKKDERAAKNNNIKVKRNDPDTMWDVRDRMEQQRQRNRDNYVDHNQTKMFDDYGNAYPIQERKMRRKK